MIKTPEDIHEEYYEKYEEPRLHIEALMTASVVTLDLSARLLYPLAGAGVTTVADLVRLHRSGLRSVRNIGEGAEAEVGRILADADLINIDQRQKDWA